mgnify:CR=1 FL=1
MNLEEDASVPDAARDVRDLGLERVRRELQIVHLIRGDQPADDDPTLGGVVATQRFELVFSKRRLAGIRKDFDAMIRDGELRLHCLVDKSSFSRGSSRSHKKQKRSLASWLTKLPMSPKDTVSIAWCNLLV